MISVSTLLDDPRWTVLIDAAEKYQDKRDDPGHTVQVVLWAAELLRAPGVPADRTVVLLAALLHDIGWSRLTPEQRSRLFESNLPAGEEWKLRRLHETQGALLARSLLEQAGYSGRTITAVTELVDGHDTREGFLSPEDGVLRDADTLWMVTNRGFEADLRRRGLSAREWAAVLRERFLPEGAFYSSSARERGLKRLARLEQGLVVPEPGESEV